MVGLGKVFLPKLNQNETQDIKQYRKFYTPRMVELMSKKYAKDLEVFGYEF